MRRGKDGIYCRYIKRILDLLFALLLCIPSVPILVICYVGIKLETRGPAFFLQERPAKTGRIIRACSFDELPQIWNVIKGDMSFIGPRPLLKKYLPLYTEEQMHRHDVLPGISGWAQVNGRNELSWEQKFDRDIWYVNNVSFALDVKILFMTVRNVFRRSGINAGVNETMMEFHGSAELRIEEAKPEVSV